jgi:hypothetical protein
VDGAVDGLAVDEALEVSVFDLDGGLGRAVGVEADFDLAGVGGISMSADRGGWIARHGVTGTGVAEPAR